MYLVGFEAIISIVFLFVSLIKKNWLHGGSWVIGHFSAVLWPTYFAPVFLQYLPPWLQVKLSNWIQIQLFIYHIDTDDSVDDPSHTPDEDETCRPEDAPRDMTLPLIFIPSTLPYFRVHNPYRV